MARGDAWQAACMVGVCITGGYVWQWACMAGGHAWQRCMCGRVACVVGMCMAGRAAWWAGACMAGEMATAADSMHATGMHSYFKIFSKV